MAIANGFDLSVWNFLGIDKFGSIFNGKTASPSPNARSDGLCGSGLGVDRTDLASVTIKLQTPSPSSPRRPSDIYRRGKVCVPGDFPVSTDFRASMISPTVARNGSAGAYCSQ
jgi:hypothetical protein